MKPKVGAIVIGDRIGYRPRDKYIWCECQLCHTARWVRIVRGEPRSRMCLSCNNKSENTHNYKGQKIDSKGYPKIKLYSDDPYYSMVARDDFVAVHRYVVAQALKRSLERWEIVHHINGIKTDNRLENLEIVSDGTHKSIYVLEQKVKELENRVTLLETENILLRGGGQR